MIKQFIISHLCVIIIGLFILTFVAISYWKCMREHNNILCDLFKQDAGILFSGETLLIKPPHEVNKDQIYNILELIKTRTYYNSNPEIKLLIDDIQRYLDGDSVKYNSFCNSSLKRYNYLVNYNQRSPLYIKEEFSCFFTMICISLAISLPMIDNHGPLLGYISNVIGLTGSIVVFIYGIPNKIDTGGIGNIGQEIIDLEEKLEIQRYKDISAAGLGLIAGSFLVNLIDLYFK